MGDEYINPFTFNYNGLIQLSGSIINKLFVAQLYERNWIEVQGIVPEDDNIWTSGFPDDPRAGLKIFLRLGPPAVDFLPATVKDTTIGMLIPFQIAAFTLTSQNPDIWERHPLRMKFDPLNLFPNIKTIILGISPIELAKIDNPEGIIPNFAELGENELSFYIPFSASDPPDFLPYPLEDFLISISELDNIPLSLIKPTILSLLKSGKLSQGVLAFPLTSLSMPDLQHWDFRLLAAENVNGIDLLLYKSETEGRGARELAGNTIPPAGDGPDYHFAINLSDTVIHGFFESTLKEQGYYTQGGTPNTPANPFGYMVVPFDTAESTYTIPVPPPLEGGPPPPNEPTLVTLRVLDHGKVRLIVPNGGFRRLSRVVLHNLDSGADVAFTADTVGAAEVDIAAIGGQRLVLEVLALITAEDPQLAVYRPNIELQKGFIHIKAHFDRVVDYFCDIEGEAYANIGLFPDLDTKMGIKIYEIGFGSELPIWLVVIASLFTFLYAWIDSKIANAFREQFKKGLFPTMDVGTLPTFLDRVQIQPNGIALSGYAEAGSIASSDRQMILLPAITPQPVPVRIAGLGISVVSSGSELILSSSEAEFNVSSLKGRQAASAFWSARYQDAPSEFPENSIVVRSFNQPRMFWAQRYGAYCKALVTWVLDSVGQRWLQITVISYTYRVRPRAEIRDHLQGIKCNPPANPSPHTTYLSYKGTIELKTKKYYRSPILRQSGLEHWFWDGEEVSPNAPLTQPGITVTWDSDEQLTVEINQTGLLPNLAPEACLHHIEFQGEDIFGSPIVAELGIWKPAFVRIPIHLQLYDEKNLLHLPTPDPWRSLLDLIQTGELMAVDEHGFIQDQQAKTVLERVGKHPIALNALRSLAEAIEQGHADLDSHSAQVLMAALLGP